jgi:hypothetical protein
MVTGREFMSQFVVARKRSKDSSVVSGVLATSSKRGPGLGRIGAVPECGPTTWQGEQIFFAMRYPSLIWESWESCVWLAKLWSTVPLAPGTVDSPICATIMIGRVSRGARQHGALELSDADRKVETEQHTSNVKNLIMVPIRACFQAHTPQGQNQE